MKCRGAKGKEWLSLEWCRQETPRWGLLRAERVGVGAGNDAQQTWQHEGVGVV